MTPLKLLGLEAAKGTYNGAKKAAIRYETVIIAVVSFYAVRYLMQKDKEKKYVTAGAGTSQAVDFARRLHDAFHPYVNLSFTIPLLGRVSPPDGTNETELKTLAAQIGSLKIGQEVSAAYKAIFGVTLEEELTSEGVYDEYITAFSSGASGGSSGSSGVSTYIKAGDTVSALAGRNLRQLQSPYNVVGTTKAGEKFTVKKLYNRSISGVSGVWLEVQRVVTFWYFGPNPNVFIFINGVTKSTT